MPDIALPTAVMKIAAVSFQRCDTQIDRALSRSQGGVGIGLALVKRLVEMRGGSVSAHSEGTGLGCRFTFRLPLAHSAISSDLASADALAQQAAVDTHTRVLVVDGSSH